MLRHLFCRVRRVPLLGSLGISRVPPVWTGLTAWLTKCCSSGILSLLIPLVAATTNLNAVSIFNLSLQSNTANYTFALNIPDGSTDLYFHLAGPTAYSWIAVGTGSEMANSMMFVMYSDAAGTSELLQSRKHCAWRTNKFSFQTSRSAHDSLRENRNQSTHLRSPSNSLTERGYTME